MKFDFQLDEPNSPSLQLHRSIWTGKTRLFADGVEVPPQPKNGLFDKNRSFVVPMPDGSQRQLVLTNPRLYDPVPAAHVDGQPLTLAKSLKTWEYVLACVPFVLVFGGLLGGGIGAAAAFANLNIMRSERPQGLRIALCCGLSLVALVVVVLLAGALQGAVNS